MTEYIIYVICLTCFYFTVSYAYNYVVGHLSILAAMQFGLVGLSIYTLAYFSQWFSVFNSIILALIPLIVISYFFAGCLVRYGTSITVVTMLVFQILVSYIFVNTVPLTGGPQGFRWHEALPSLSFSEKEATFCLILIAIMCVVTSLFFSKRLKLKLLAVGDDHDLAALRGINVKNLIWGTLVWAGVWSFVAAIFFCSAVQLITPNIFNLQNSVIALTIGILGGAGKPIGPVIGVVLIVILPEWIYWLDFGIDNADNFRIIVTNFALLFALTTGFSKRQSIRSRAIS